MAGVWHAFGVASGSTWISTGGPSMQGSARCGHVLKVEEAYRSRSHAFMRPLLSGVHGKGSLAGRNGVTSCWGQEHDTSLLALGVLQPSLKDLTSDVAGCTFLVLWGMSLLWFTPLGLSAEVKICDRMPRFSRDSYDKYMALTELLTYTIDRHEDFSPFRDLAVSLAKNAPSIDILERFAAESLRLTGEKSSRQKPQARNSSSDHRSDCAPVSAIAEMSMLCSLAVEGLWQCLAGLELSREIDIETLG